MAQIKYIRAKEEYINTIPYIDGQLILTDKGNIYADFPGNVRQQMSITLIGDDNNFFNITKDENGNTVIAFNEEALSLADIAKTGDITDLQQGETGYIVFNCGTATINI